MDCNSGSSLSSSIDSALYIAQLMPNVPLNELVLASSSSRRRQLLDLLDLRYSIKVPNVDESLIQGEKPIQFVSRLARAKAQELIKLSDYNHSVLAADTTISMNDEVIGKPDNFLHAKRILWKLSSNEHDVITGVCLIHLKNEYQTTVSTKVKFKKLSNSVIHAYCSTEEPYDKAGAYAIQGSAADFIEYISGSYTNVVGLPLLEVCELLKRANL